MKETLKFPYAFASGMFGGLWLLLWYEILKGYVDIFYSFDKIILINILGIFGIVFFAGLYLRQKEIDRRYKNGNNHEKNKMDTRIKPCR